MDELRKYKRVSIDNVAANLRPGFRAEVINISPGGVALKAKTMLVPGAEHVLSFTDRGKEIYLRGDVVWSERIGILYTGEGETIPIYHGGIRFTSVSDDQWFMPDIQINIVGHNANHAEDMSFSVTRLSTAGLHVISTRALDVGEVFPVTLTLPFRRPVRFFGSVAFCKIVVNGGDTKYEIGIGILDITDDDRAVLFDFVQPG